MLGRIVAVLVGTLGQYRPVCQCGGCYEHEPPDLDVDGAEQLDECPEHGHIFFCPGCLTYRSWCFGCDDPDPYLARLCDDCWCEVT